MFDWLHVSTAGLWPLVWHFGVAGGLVLACAAGVYFAPTLKSKLWFVAIAAIIAVFSIAVATGVSLGEKRIKSQWDAAKVVTVDRTKKARVGAIRDVARKPRRWLPNKLDPDIRD
jgi:hypothetical protein